MSKEDVCRLSSSLPDVVSPRHQATQSCVLNQILNVMGTLDKKVDALDKKVDELSKNVVIQTRDQVEITPIEDEYGCVPKMNHTMDTSLKDEDVHTIDNNVETITLDGGVDDAPTMNANICVPLEVEQQFEDKDTSNAKINVHEKEEYLYKN